MWCPSQGVEVGEMSSAGLPGGSTQCETNMRSFHVTTIVFTGGGGSGEVEAAAPLQPVQNSRAIGETHKAFTDGLMRQ